VTSQNILKRVCLARVCSCSTGLQFFVHTVKFRVSNTRPVDRMWPSRTFCPARDASWEFSNN